MSLWLSKFCHGVAFQADANHWSLVEVQGHLGVASRLVRRQSMPGCEVLESVYETTGYLDLRMSRKNCQAGIVTALSTVEPLRLARFFIDFYIPRGLRSDQRAGLLKIFDVEWCTE